MSDTHVCKFCNKPFKLLSTMTAHVCEPKRRHLARNEKHVKLGYKAYVRFFELNNTNQFDPNGNEMKTYEQFAKSNYYNAFCKFGSFVSNSNPLYPSQFIDWVVRSGVKLSKWCDESLYNDYVLQLIKTESVETALERGIKHMEAWAIENNSIWLHYFKYVSINRFIYDIKDGNISPWLILNCRTGQEMLTRLSDDHLDMIMQYIDPAFWTKRFKLRPADVQLVIMVAKESNI